jgi:YidC/Oxa1 family membrane protein insertase
MNDQKNMMLAIVLSAIVLIVWQVFFGMPHMQQQKQQQQQQQTQTQPVTPPGTAPQPGTPGTQPAPSQATPAPGQLPGQVPGQGMTREAALKASPRVAIETPRLGGSINLKGARIDDLTLTQYRETVDPKSPPVVLLAPSGAPLPFYGEFGWVAAAGNDMPLPTSDTVWKQEGSGTLGVGRPVTLVHDNGKGLEFRRTISVDDKYMFTVRDEVVNKGAEPTTIYPYALISRHGHPQLQGFYILHEGLIGVFGDQGLKEVTYADIEKQKQIPFKATNAWLGITDKYWAAALVPDTDAALQASFTAGQAGTTKTYQTQYLLDPVTVQPGGTGSANARMFAGAKEVAIVGLDFTVFSVDGYNKELGLNRFDLLIDWGYFYFITKPLFLAMDAVFRYFGNFGIAILLVTVIIKLFFFPLANKSYASMAKMKAVQPEMMAIRDRYADDKVKQQQALMELYKKEKINPIAGCLPILIQIPVFFALYKVLFVTIEMRHAPFFGWIKDLSAPDPTTIFNLFGLIPWDPSTVPVIGHFLMLGVWPIIMGITMWLQMKLNPAPTEPSQKIIFDWMPVIFTFMLAGFSAGLVIYWAWNNILSVAQQSYIMHRHGAKIELWDNVKELFGVKRKQA